ncbi:hypothetical protein HanRHA438_Chr16g0777681 [Helianthus annuus]|nr:hypothetical protein HanRHA438_Chr16g0777681 [Helianthus annuus]
MSVHGLGLPGCVSHWKGMDAVAWCGGVSVPDGSGWWCGVVEKSGSLGRVYGSGCVLDTILCFERMNEIEMELCLFVYRWLFGVRRMY